MKDNKSASLFQKEQVMESLKQSFVKLNPRVMIKNPIMFTVEVVTVVMLIVCFLSLGTSEYGAFGYNFLVFIILFVTLLFANFAEAIAEARGKAQADSLRKTREETPAKVLVDGKIHTVSSSRLKKGDYFICEAGDTIPADGEIVEGLASIDESAITGESAPVIREAGGDKSSVTGGTKVLSDHIKVVVCVRIATDRADIFHDRACHAVRDTEWIAIYVISHSLILFDAKWSVAHSFLLIIRKQTIYIPVLKKERGFVIM